MLVLGCVEGVGCDRRVVVVVLPKINTALPPTKHKRLFVDSGPSCPPLGPQPFKFEGLWGHRPPQHMWIRVGVWDGGGAWNGGG